MSECKLETFCTVLGGAAGTMFGLVGFLAGPAVGCATTSGGMTLGVLGGRVLGRGSDDFHEMRKSANKVEHQANEVLTDINAGLTKGKKAWGMGKKVVNVLNVYLYLPEIVAVIALQVLQSALEGGSLGYKPSNIEQISTVLDAAKVAVFTFRTAPWMLDDLTRMLSALEIKKSLSYEKTQVG